MGNELWYEDTRLRPSFHTKNICSLPLLVLSYSFFLLHIGNADRCRLCSICSTRKLCITRLTTPNTCRNPTNLGIGTIGTFLPCTLHPLNSIILNLISWSISCAKSFCRCYFFVFRCHSQMGLPGLSAQVLVGFIRTGVIWPQTRKDGQATLQPRSCAKVRGGF
jgi:hypothetical protein